MGRPAITSFIVRSTVSTVLFLTYGVITQRWKCPLQILLGDSRTENNDASYTGVLSCAQVRYLSKGIWSIFGHVRDCSCWEIILSYSDHILWRPLIIIADNVISRLLLSKSVVPKHSI
jgi:hypothetical protein